MKKTINYVTGSLIAISIVITVLDILIKNENTKRIYESQSAQVFVLGLIMVLILNQFVVKKNVFSTLFGILFFIALVSLVLTANIDPLGENFETGMFFYKLILSSFALSIISGIIAVIKK